MTTVLCVDDNAELAEILSDLLEMLEFDAWTVPGGAECLASLRNGRTKPDIILLDIMMEPMDGWMTLRNIRNDPILMDIPVVMLTGKYPTLNDVTEYGALIDGYLMKPFAIESISSEITDVLDRVRRREGVIDLARNNGADEGMLVEYRGLSSIVHVTKHLMGLFKNRTFSHVSIDVTEKRLEALEKQLSDLRIRGN